MRKNIKRAGTIAIAATAVTLGSVFSATAAQAAAVNPPAEGTITTVAPGGKVDVALTMSNGDAQDRTANLGFTLTAPDHATFTETQIWHASATGGAWGGSAPTACTRSSDMKTLTCVPTSQTVPARANNANGELKMTAQVQVADDAPADTLFNNGSFTMTTSDATQIAAGNGALGYRTAPAADTPIIAPVIGAGALGLAAIAGVGGLVVRRKRNA